MAGIKDWNSDLNLLGKAIINTVPNATGTVLTYNPTSKEVSTRTNAEIKADLGFRNNLNIDGTGFNFPSIDAVNTGLSLRVPYTGATQDLNLNTKNLIINGEISFGSSNAKVSWGTPIASSSYGLILYGYDGIELQNRSFYNSPTIFTMNGVEKARVQYNGDFKNEGVLLPQKGIIVKGFSPIIKQKGIDGGTSLIFIKTGYGEAYYNMTEFKVVLKTYSTSGLKHYEFIVSTYFIRGSTTNLFPSITWVAGNSTDITAIKFYKKDSGGYESYIAIEGSFDYPQVSITEAQVAEGASNTLHPDYWSIDFGSSADLTGKSVTNTFLPNDFKRDKTWLDANYANQSWVTSQLGNYIPLSQKGVANGVATLDSSGLVPASQLPSYVDDVLEFANLASFPSVGESGKIYVALNTNLTYRWGGSSYIQIASGAVQSVNGQTGVVNLTYSDVGAEQAFTKNTAFNKNFGTTSNTVTEGNDSRINNGQTAYNWGNHADAGYAVSGWVVGNYQSLNNNLTGISNLNLTNSSVGLLKKISGPPGSNNWVLDTSVYATQTWVTSQGYITANDVLPVYNGQINYIGVGAIEGGGVSNANQSVNTHYSFDLTQATKDNINKGVIAYGWGNHSLAGYVKVSGDFIHDGTVSDYDLSTDGDTYLHNISIESSNGLDVLNLSNRHTLTIRNSNSASCPIKINSGSTFSINGYSTYVFYMTDAGKIIVTELVKTTSEYT